MTGQRLGVTVVRGVLLAIVAGWTLFPIYYMVSLAITPWSDLFRPVYFVKNPTLDNFKFVLFQESPFVKYFWRWLANSLLVSGAVMVAVLCVAAMGSFALGRIRFAVVDEDQSLLTGFLRGALHQVIVAFIGERNEGAGHVLVMDPLPAFHRREFGFAQRAQVRR